MWVERLLMIWWTILQLSTRGVSQSQNQVRATINKPLSLKCTLPILLVNLTYLSWNRCSTEDQCRADWDKHRIAHITDKTEVHLDYPERYKLDTNGTLTIKEVLPEDDNKVFICRGTVALIGVEENTTVLKIISEQPKITTRNPFENEIIEGMPLMLEFKVHGYPYPLITLRHNGEIILKGTKMDSMYIRQNASKMYNGDYTCTAENPLGNASLTIKVKIIERDGTNCTSSHENGTAEQPKITTRNPFENEIIEGMPLMLEFKVHGYPYPLITLRHNGEIILKGTKMDSMYIRQNASKMYNGDYTCTAENPLGNASLTIKVKIIERDGTNCTSSHENGTADHINTEGSRSCILWKAFFGVVFGLFGASLLFTKRHKVWGWVKPTHPITSQNGGGSLELPTARNIKRHDAQSRDPIIGGSQDESEGTNGLDGVIEALV